MAQTPDQKTSDVMRIDASPTKQLFIEMLIKDITLRDAIGDLVDNSVDASKRAATGSKNLSSYWIKIEATGQHFKISDNCGGLEADTARTSAFCFGKPKGYKQGKHTIGQFGIGMKRAFFKIGNYIEVESKALTSYFKMHIDVNKWRELPKWDFEFDELKEDQNTLLSNTYTSVNITDLNEDTREKFNDGLFITDLVNEISLEHLYTINQGLSIFINEIKLKPRPITLTYDKELGIEPVYWQHIFKNKLSAEIVAGVSEDVGVDGGWYIFCNERLILGPDTTEITGRSGGNNKEMPKYHDQFFRFRGYVFFNSDDSSKLPWNTTKNGMDLDSPAFILVRNQMIIIAKQVKKLMDDMKKERERGNPETKRVLSNAINNAKIVPVNDVMEKKGSLPAVYKYPEHLLNVAPKAKKSGVKLTFYKPDSIVQEVKTYFNVDDSNSAAEMAFDSFYENEIE